MTVRIFKKGFNYSQDGPGNRLVYHLQGCNMRCRWCANPESFESAAGKEYTVESIVDEAAQCSALYYDGGGVTLTGGEPTLQFEAVENLLECFKKNGIHTAIETNATHPMLEILFPNIDFLIMDFKHYDNEIHKMFTGVDNVQIKSNILKAFKLHKKVLIRIPLVKGFNASLQDMENFMAFFKGQNTGHAAFELLPYHEYGKVKWERLGLPYRMKDAFIDPEALSVYEKLFADNHLSVVRT